MSGARAAACHDGAGSAAVSSQGERAFRAEVFGWCLRRARVCREGGVLEPALRWLELAARMAAGVPFGHLGSPELEVEGLAIAARLPPLTREGTATVASPDTARLRGRSRWLHVFTEVYEIGGHTIMAARWFGLDAARAHSAVLLGQKQPVPSFFPAAVTAGGGRVHRLDVRASLLQRAARLRALAWAEADVVVLHVHPWDVVPLAAFGVAGGPPVVLLNHADHLFWVGGAVSDLVLDLRPSGQEWTLRHRGIPRNALLPVIVPDPESPQLDPKPAARHREDAKRQLGLPPDSVMLLTVARGVKYESLPGYGLDFLGAALALLKAHPHAWVLAVGRQADARWEEARQVSGGRLRAEGPQRDLRRYHAAADIYLESVPIGSATAILEAAMHSLPCVRGPRSVPPPLNTGGPGILVLEQPDDLDGYIRQASNLIESPDARRACGESVAASVRACHGPTAWLAQLGNVVSRIPAAHALHPPAAAEPLPDPVAAFWAEYVARTRSDNTLIVAMESALEDGLAPRLDRSLRRAIGRPDRWRGADSRRLSVLLRTNVLLRVLTPPAYRRLYRGALKLETALWRIRRPLATRRP